MEKVHPRCGQPSDRGQLKNITELTTFKSPFFFQVNLGRPALFVSSSATGSEENPLSSAGF